MEKKKHRKLRYGQRFRRKCFLAACIIIAVIAVPGLIFYYLEYHSFPYEDGRQIIDATLSERFKAYDSVIAETLQVDENAIFSDAVRVTDMNSFEQALDDSRTGSIVITSDLKISEGLILTVPVCIEEGVTVSDTGSGSFQIMDKGACLINHGTCSVSLRTYETCFCINYGTYVFRDISNFTLWLSDDSRFINNGYVLCDDTSRIYDNGFFYNVGKTDAYELELMGGVFVNDGEVHLYDHFGTFNGAEFINRSVVTCDDSCYVESFGMFRNSGTSEGIAKRENSNAFLHEPGLILTGKKQCKLPAAGESVAMVKNLRMLKKAMSDERVSYIVIPADTTIEVKDLNVTKPMFLLGNLRTDKGHTLSLSENAYVYQADGSLDVTDAALTVTDASAYICDGGGICSDRGRIDIADGSVFFADGKNWSSDELRMQSEDSEVMIFSGVSWNKPDIKLMSSDVRICGGGDSFYGGYVFSDGESSIRSYQNDIKADGGFVFENKGFARFFAYDEFRIYKGDCSIKNEGELTTDIGVLNIN